MTFWKSVVLSAIACAGVFAAFSSVKAAHSQISVGVNIGPAPVCPYGYFDYAPYDCAPYGYYGPDWFVGGIFIGAGPWFHGATGFHGHVDNRFDPHHGYNGPLPSRGSKQFNHFQANEARDGRGHVVEAPNHDGANEHALPGFRGSGGRGGGGRR